MNGQEDVLNPRQEKFVDAIMAGKSNTQAAIEAGYNTSYDYAAVAGHRLINNAKVNKRIKKRREAAAQLIDADIIGTLVEQMNFDITKCLDSNGNIDFQKVQKKGLGHLLQQVETKEVSVGKNKTATITKIKGYSAQTAAIQLAKIKGLDNHTKNININVNNSSDKRSKLIRMITKQMVLGISFEDAKNTVQYMLYVADADSSELENISESDIVLPEDPQKSIEADYAIVNDDPKPAANLE
jgi:phage terminase small subunit